MIGDLVYVVHRSVSRSEQTGFDRFSIHVAPAREVRRARTVKAQGGPFGQVMLDGMASESGRDWYWIVSDNGLRLVFDHGPAELARFLAGDDLPLGEPFSSGG